MNILKLVFSNIRKRKGASITFLVMIILSAIMLSISLNLILESGSFYSKKSNELNSPHYLNLIPKESYKDEYTKFVQDYDEVTDVSVLDAIFFIGSWNMKEGKKESTIILMDTNEIVNNSFQKLNIIDKQEKEFENSIVLPVSFKSSGLAAGDSISFNVGETRYEFIVYGFFEDAVMGASTIGASIAYVGSNNFDKLYVDENFNEYKSLTVRFNEPNKVTAFQADFNEMAGLLSNQEFIQTYYASEVSSMSFINMLLMVLIIFSFIILLIAFVVVRFSITSSIEEDITIIGALKSIGYKNKALRGSQLIQYLLIAVIGSIIGAVISLLTFPLIGDIVASTSSLLWTQSVNLLPVFLAVILISILTALIIYIATKNYKKITPINALRQGESNHSFKKNKMPLNKYKMPLNIHLGIKKFFKNAKNNITIFFVTTLLVFISGFVFTMSYNFNYDKSATIQMIGLEMAELWAQTNKDADIYEIESQIANHDEVKSTMLNGTLACKVDGYDSYITTTEDYSKLITNTIIEGKHPELYNEITLGAVVLKAIDKKVGDTVTLEIQGTKTDYIVVGVSQSIGSNGTQSEIIEEAITKQYPEFKMDTIYIYLNDNVDVESYNNRLKSIYGNKLITVDTTKQIDSILSSMGEPFAAISMIMIVVTIVIIGFVLFLIISALIRREKKEIGIMKAIGYKNKYLAAQLLISLLPSLIIGTAVGIILVIISTNTLLSLLMLAAGLLNTYFIIPIIPVILISMGVFIASILTIYFVSHRMKKISPQKLIVE